MEPKIYPMWIERMALIAGVVAAIFAGIWTWEQDYSLWIQWGISVCILPTLVLFFTEFVGRILQGSR